MKGARISLVAHYRPCAEYHLLVLVVIIGEAGVRGGVDVLVIVAVVF